MGRNCRICKRSRPNEHFGGRGMRAVVCSKCRQRPKVDKLRILATDEFHGFLLQKNISAKNIMRLVELEAIEDDDFQQLRRLVLEIATVHPRKPRRWKAMKENHPNLYSRIVVSEQFDHLLDELYDSTASEIADDHEDVEYFDVWLENREP